MFNIYQDVFDEPILGFRFSVSFMGWGDPANLLDTRFQRVSGLSAAVSTRSVNEGGENLHAHKIPERVGYGNLTLERGMVMGSKVDAKLNRAISLFQFETTDVLVRLLAEDRSTLAAWFFHRAYPVKWETSALSATEASVVIDTLELAYARMQILRS